MPTTWTPELDRRLLLTAVKISNVSNTEVANEYIKLYNLGMTAAAVGKRMERLKKMDSEGVTGDDDTPKATKTSKSTTPRSKKKSAATTPSSNKSNKRKKNVSSDEEDLPDYVSDAEDGTQLPTPKKKASPARKTPSRAKKVAKIYKESSASADEYDADDFYTTTADAAAGADANATTAVDTPMEGQSEDGAVADNKENQVAADTVNANGIEEIDMSVTATDAQA